MNIIFYNLTFFEINFNSEQQASLGKFNRISLQCHLCHRKEPWFSQYKRLSSPYSRIKELNLQKYISRKPNLAEEPMPTSGLYRTDLVLIFPNPSTVLATPIEIPGLVHKRFDSINVSTGDEVEIMAYFHSWFVKAHRLSEGNGGCVRLIRPFLAITAGLAGFAIRSGVQ